MELFKVEHHFETRCFYRALWAEWCGWDLKRTLSYRIL